MKKILVILVTVLPFVNGCDNSAPENATAPIDREAVRRSIVENCFLPANRRFFQNAQKLALELNALRDSLSEATLLQAQQAWVETYGSWPACSFTKVGDISDTYIHNKLYTWPAKASFIEKHVVQNEDFPDDFAEKLGSNSKGLGAIEYILFEDGRTSATEILNNLKSDPKRAQFVASIGANVSFRSSELVNKWEEYSTSFVTNQAIGVSGSINILANVLIRKTEQLKINLLRKPMGLEDGGEPDPTLAQAYRSEQSILGVRETIKALKTLYFGLDSLGNDGLGIDDLLLDPATVSESDKALHQRILKSFSELEVAASNVEGSLVSALANDYNALNELHEKSGALFVLFYVDLSNAMGVQVTFGDSDGD